LVPSDQPRVAWFMLNNYFKQWYLFLVIYIH
jgi:hypothetical protein